jgi:uncharacterized membrane protein YkoI
MKLRFTTLALAFSLTALPLTIACGSGEKEEAEESEAAEAASQAELLKEATIDEAAARKTALAEVPGGEITKAELEKEDSLLIWSFDIKVEGKEGIEEVHVDAKTGKAVKREHESGGGEAR